jgi:hypothetical protein
MGSRFRALAEGLRGRLPRRAIGRQIDCIIWVIPGTGEGGLSRIGGIHYTACAGHTHPLDGQSVDFGDYGIPREEVPSPWRELLADAATPFTFSLDRPDQDETPTSTEVEKSAHSDNHI